MRKVDKTKKFMKLMQQHDKRRDRDWAITKRENTKLNNITRNYDQKQKEREANRKKWFDDKFEKLKKQKNK